METKKKLKPIKDDAPEKVPFMVYLKGFLLTAAVLVGVFYLNRVASNKRETVASEKEEKASSLPSVSDISKNFSQEAVKKRIEEEIRTNQAYNKTIKDVQDKTENVLGEASKAAETVVVESAEIAKDHIYEYTYGKVVEGIVNALPKRQKDLLLQRMCEEK